MRLRELCVALDRAVADADGGLWVGGRTNPNSIGAAVEACGPSSATAGLLADHRAS